MFIIIVIPMTFPPGCAQCDTHPGEDKWDRVFSQNHLYNWSTWFECIVSWRDASSRTYHSPSWHNLRIVWDRKSTSQFQRHHTRCTGKENIHSVACVFLGVSCWRLQTSGVWPSVTVWVVLDVWKDHNVFIFVSHPRRPQSAATLLWERIVTSFILSSSFWFHSESHVHLFFQLLCPSSHFYINCVKQKTVITMNIQIMWYSENRGSRFLYPKYMMSRQVTEHYSSHSTVQKPHTSHGVALYGRFVDTVSHLHINRILCCANWHISLNFKIIFSSIL